MTGIDRREQDKMQQVSECSLSFKIHPLRRASPKVAVNIGAGRHQISTTAHYIVRYIITSYRIHLVPYIPHNQGQRRSYQKHHVKQPPKYPEVR